MFDTRRALLRLEMWADNTWYDRLIPVGPFVEAGGLECLYSHHTAYYIGYQPVSANGIPTYAVFCSEEEAVGVILPESVPHIFGSEHPRITWPEARKRGVNYVSD
jgi:hypothetical protein